MNIVLFACIHNAGRSQMAAALFNQISDPQKARAISAGTEPGDRVHPEVIAAMSELGVDLAAEKPRKLTDDLAQTASMLVTMGCGEACPVVPGIERDDWPLADPKGQSIGRVREIRSQIRSRVRELVIARGWLPISIRRAVAADRASVHALLRASGLTEEGVDAHFDDFLVALDEASAIVGSVGLEIHGGCALLRSLAVAPRARARGAGSALTQQASSGAHRRGVREVYLLTTSAPEFFAKLGFERIARARVPAAIAASDEFARVCPESAVVMRSIV